MREPLDVDPEQLPVARPRPVVTWRPRTGKVRPCPVCGIPRWSTSASDRLHPKCRPAGEQNDGEAAALLLP